jgi:hypothetical protein
MIVFLAAMALVLVLLYFATLGWRPDDGWQRFRRRFRERIRRPPPEQGMGPTFRFDQPPTDITEGKHSHQA